jgi:hypothetical protein
VANLDARVKALEAQAPNRRNCFVVTLPEENAEQKVADYVAQYGERPLDVFRVNFVDAQHKEDDDA